MKKITLNEMINDAVLYGYDLQSILSNIKVTNKEFDEYLYGYTLSEDRASYIEDIISGNVEKCDKIYFYQHELNQYLARMKAMPHTKIISGFHLLEDIQRSDGSTYNASNFRIILIDDTSKTALIKDIELAEQDGCEVFSVWSANLYYKQAIQTMEDYGEDELFSTAEEIADLFIMVEDIKLWK